MPRDGEAAVESADWHQARSPPAVTILASRLRCRAPDQSRWIIRRRVSTRDLVGHNSFYASCKFIGGLSRDAPAMPSRPCYAGQDLLRHVKFGRSAAGSLGRFDECPSAQASILCSSNIWLDRTAIGDVVFYCENCGELATMIHIIWIEGIGNLERQTTISLSNEFTQNCRSVLPDQRRKSLLESGVGIVAIELRDLKTNERTFQNLRGSVAGRTRYLINGAGHQPWDGLQGQHYFSRLCAHAGLLPDFSTFLQRPAPSALPQARQRYAGHKQVEGHVDRRDGSLHFCGNERGSSQLRVGLDGGPLKNAQDASATDTPFSPSQTFHQFDHAGDVLVLLSLTSRLHSFERVLCLKSDNRVTGAGSLPGEMAQFFMDALSTGHDQLRDNCPSNIVKRRRIGETLGDVRLSDPTGGARRLRGFSQKSCQWNAVGRTPIDQHQNPVASRDMHVLGSDLGFEGAQIVSAASPDFGCTGVEGPCIDAKTVRLLPPRGRKILPGNSTGGRFDSFCRCDLAVGSEKLSDPIASNACCDRLAETMLKNAADFLITFVALPETESPPRLKIDHRVDHVEMVGATAFRVLHDDSRRTWPDPEFLFNQFQRLDQFLVGHLMARGDLDVNQLSLNTSIGPRQGDQHFHAESEITARVAAKIASDNHSLVACCRTLEMADQASRPSRAGLDDHQTSRTPSARTTASKAAAWSACRASIISRSAVLGAPRFACFATWLRLLPCFPSSAINARNSSACGGARRVGGAFIADFNARRIIERAYSDGPWPRNPAVSIRSCNVGVSSRNESTCGYRTERSVIGYAFPAGVHGGASPWQDPSNARVNLESLASEHSYRKDDIGYKTILKIKMVSTPYSTQVVIICKKLTGSAINFRPSCNEIVYIDVDVKSVLFLAFVYEKSHLVETLFIFPSAAPSRRMRA